MLSYTYISIYKGLFSIKFIYNIIINYIMVANNYSKKKFLASYFILFLIFACIGVLMIIIGEDTKIRVIGIISTIFFGGGFVILIMRLIQNPQKFWETQKRVGFYKGEEEFQRQRKRNISEFKSNFKTYSLNAFYLFIFIFVFGLLVKYFGNIFLLTFSIIWLFSILYFRIIKKSLKNIFGYGVTYFWLLIVIILMCIGFILLIAKYIPWLSFLKEGLFFMNPAIVIVAYSLLIYGIILGVVIKGTFSTYTTMSIRLLSRNPLKPTEDKKLYTIGNMVIDFSIFLFFIDLFMFPIFASFIGFIKENNLHWYFIGLMILLFIIFPIIKLFKRNK